MDIEKFIRARCNYGYVIERDDGKAITIILGDSGGLIDKSASFYDYNIVRKFSQMEKLFSLETLTRDDKISLAKTMSSMKSLCNRRMIGLATLDEQVAFINELTDNERQQLENQIKMRIVAEQYYREYLA